jgi:uncharacterized RDD family membrane protein YckC
MSEGVNLRPAEVELKRAGAAGQSAGSFIDAGNGRRLANKIADEFLICVMFGTAFRAIGMDAWNSWVRVVAYYFLFVAYYVFAEALLGRTPAKLITRTRVITLTGEKSGFTRVLGRTLARLVPFEPFSFLFADRGWHDRWSGTRVVLERKRQFGDFR